MYFCAYYQNQCLPIKCMWVNESICVSVKECRPRRSLHPPCSETPAGWTRRGNEQKPQQQLRCGTIGGSGTKKQRQTETNTVNEMSLRDKQSDIKCEKYGESAYNSL